MPKRGVREKWRSVKRRSDSTRQSPSDKCTFSMRFADLQPPVPTSKPSSPSHCLPFSPFPSLAHSRSPTSSQQLHVILRPPLLSLAKNRSNDVSYFLFLVFVSCLGFELLLNCKASKIVVRLPTHPKIFFSVLAISFLVPGVLFVCYSVGRYSAKAADRARGRHRPVPF